VTNAAAAGKAAKRIGAMQDIGPASALPVASTIALEVFGHDLSENRHTVFRIMLYVACLREAA
jgi:hypothetical protein